MIPKVEFVILQSPKSRSPLLVLLGPNTLLHVVVDKMMGSTCFKHKSGFTYCVQVFVQYNTCAFSLTILIGKHVGMLGTRLGSVNIAWDDI